MWLEHGNWLLWTQWCNDALSGFTNLHIIFVIYQTMMWNQIPAETLASTADYIQHADSLPRTARSSRMDGISYIWRSKLHQTHHFLNQAVGTEKHLKPCVFAGKSSANKEKLHDSPLPEVQSSEAKQRRIRIIPVNHWSLPTKRIVWLHKNWLRLIVRATKQM